MDIHELTGKVARHLAQRPVKIRWQNPPSKSAVGQTIRTPDGELVIYIANLEGINTRFKIFLHELSHCRLDHDWIPISNDHLRPEGSIKRDPEARAAWREHPRETRADALADEWFNFAERNAWRYDLVDRTLMECKLLSLLDWEG